MIFEILVGVGVTVLFGSLLAISVGLVIGLTRKRWRVLKYSGIVAGASFGFLVLVAIVGSIVDPVEEAPVASAPPVPPAPTATPQPKATPTPMPSFTVNSFILERAKNIRRFDNTYKGERMLMLGPISTVDRDMLFISGSHPDVKAALDDLPGDVLDRVSARELFMAECEYDKYGSGYIFLKKCDEVR